MTGAHAEGMIRRLLRHPIFITGAAATALAALGAIATRDYQIDLTRLTDEGGDHDGTGRLPVDRQGLALTVPARTPPAGRPTNPYETTVPTLLVEEAVLQLRLHSPDRDCVECQACTTVDQLEGYLPRCRECGCTNLRACATAVGSCRWAQPDLCSGCAS